MKTLAELYNLPTKKNKRCNKCGFRIRGKKHIEGQHHLTKHRPLKQNNFNEQALLSN